MRRRFVTLRPQLVELVAQARRGRAEPGQLRRKLVTLATTCGSGTRTSCFRRERRFAAIAAQPHDLERSMGAWPHSATYSSGTRPGASVSSSISAGSVAPNGASAAA